MPARRARLGLSAAQMRWRPAREFMWTAPAQHTSYSSKIYNYPASYEKCFIARLGLNRGSVMVRLFILALRDPRERNANQRYLDTLRETE
jgi:hypothetical protein